MKKGSRCEKAIKPMIGKVYGNLTIVSYADRKKTKWGYVNLWRCKCVCGNEVTVMGTSLRYGNTKSCGCLKKKKYQESARNRYLFCYQQDAKRKGRNFELTKEEFFDLVFGNCHYCGRSPQRAYPTPKSCAERCIHGSILVNGIDRIDNNEGYIRENCVSCCEICNLAKRKMTYQDFLNWINVIVNFRRQIDGEKKA